MNYIEEVEDIRLEVMKNIEKDSNFIPKLSEGAGIGMYAILALIHHTRPTNRASINKIKTFLAKDK